MQFDAFHCKLKSVGGKSENVKPRKRADKWKKEWKRKKARERGKLQSRKKGSGRECNSYEAATKPSKLTKCCVCDMHVKAM